MKYLLTGLYQDYDEEDDGFLFTRTKERKVRASPPIRAPVSAPVAAEPQSGHKDESESVGGKRNWGEAGKRKKRTKMSFSTPNAGEEKPMRRSKRLSDEHNRREGSPQPKARKKETIEPASTTTVQKQAEDQLPAREKAPAVQSDRIVGEEHSATRIALPFADTPVIRRNKAMREGKSGKGERRSSLGLRGRRASSLIDSGNSNGRQTQELFQASHFDKCRAAIQLLTMGAALPHDEVEATDFYKHIESKGLPEPRRMRQLLTWCATRAMGEKPTGTEFEDQSARMAGESICCVLPSI